MIIHCSYDEMVPLEKLVPNPQNPNEHPLKQVKLLAKIMKASGVRKPITVSKRSGFIVTGHCRLESAAFNHWDEYPVDYQDFENEAVEYAHMIADNKLPELAKHDDKMMVETIKEKHRNIDPDLIGIPDLSFIDKQKKETKTTVEFTAGANKDKAHQCPVCSHKFD